MTPVALCLLAACALTGAHNFGRPWGHNDRDSWGHRSGSRESWHGHSHQGWQGRPATTSARPSAPTSAPSTTQRPLSTSSPAVPAEARSLSQLYKDAVAEGGRVIIYAGGDTPGQQDYFKDLFEKAFPGVTMDIIVDYSKYHDARIDNQLANNSLVPDVVQLQTLQDFPRWKQQGVLLQYKPSSWDAIYNEFKDVDGYYTPIYVLSFTNCINKYLLPDRTQWPIEANDYLKPELKGKITLSYPNDDDAVLFLYKNLVDKYGWQYVQKFVQQDIRWVRGTQEPTDAVVENRTAAAPSTACAMNNPDDSAGVYVLPKKDPFVTWPQQAAIFKGAKRPAAAKLYLNWITSLDIQSNYIDGWPVRRDATPVAGYKNVFEYPGQTDPTAFGKWMQDRGAVERFRLQIQQYVGEVQGEPSPGHLGLYPEKALPH